MDPRELKALLKEAKNDIKSKDFATTIKNCKAILKKEPEHYQANLYLGTAMKEQGKWQQAVECYKKATEIDPAQVYAWQGIILVYEKQGIKVHKDLLDAYKRVATFFEKDDKQKYIESTKKLAYVLISQEDHKSALKVITRLSKSVGVKEFTFTTALDLCSVPGTQFPVSEEEMKHILFNRITILVKMGQYEEAREVFSTVEELGTVGFLNAALTLAKLGDLESSEQLYLQLDERLESDRDKLDLKIALAMIASKAGRPDVACSLLSDKSMIKNPHALLALSAMRVLSSNVDIVAGTMWPLKKLLDYEDFVADVGLKRSCFQIMQGSTRSGVNELLKLLRMYPGNGRLWSLTSQMLYRYQVSVIPASALRNVTLKALRLSSSKGKKTEDTSITSQSSAMISLSYLIGSDWKTAIPTALKGIRNYPEVRENWVVLACGLWHQFVDRKCADSDVYQKLVKLLEKELKLNRVSIRAQAWILEFLRLIDQYSPMRC